MKILVCLDSFKGSMTSIMAGNIVKETLQQSNKNYLVEVCPISDGGEGFLDAISYSNFCQEVIANVSNPYGEIIKAKYLVKDYTAYIESSTCIGLNLIEKKDPLYTTTYGLGELILHAIKNNCKNFIIGIGGSCTNDGGVGMLQALGYEFLDKDNQPIKSGAIGLKDLRVIKKDNAINLQEYNFKIACDVKNGLCGKKGASFVYARQKGATDSQIKLMDKWLKNYAKLTKKIFKNANPKSQGAGASGGLGFAFKEYLKGEIISGIDCITSILFLKEKIINSDIVIVGEGKLDKQSLMGKAPLGIARLAKQNNKKVIALAGILDLSNRQIKKSNIDFAYQIKPDNQNIGDAIKQENATKNLINATKKIAKNI